MRSAPIVQAWIRADVAWASCTAFPVESYAARKPAKTPATLPAGGGEWSSHRQYRVTHVDSASTGAMFQARREVATVLAGAGHRGGVAIREFPSAWRANHAL